MKSIRSKFFAILAMCMMLTACAQVGLAPAETFDQKLAYGYSTLAAVRISSADALKTGAITVSDAKQALVITDTARASLDAASAANGAGDVSTAIGKLQAATALLTQLQQYLQSKGVK